MKKRYPIIPIIWIIVLLFSMTMCAQDNALITALKKNYLEKSSLELTFDLDIFWKVREKHEKKKGNLKIMPKDNFRLKLGSWEWVCDGHTYWQYNEKTSQVIIKNLLDVERSMHPSRIIERYLSYNVTVSSTNDKETIFNWVSPDKDSKKGFAGITLWVDAKKVTLKKIVATDNKGNVSTYNFTKANTEAQIPSQTFTFKIPKGVEVLDSRD